MLEKEKSMDYWTLILTVASVILGALTFLAPEQRTILVPILLGALIASIVFFYVNKISSNEKRVLFLGNEVKKIKENFNYVKEFVTLKAEVEMLKKKKGQINIIDLFRIVILIILFYVIVDVLKTLF